MKTKKETVVLTENIVEVCADQEYIEAKKKHDAAGIEYMTLKMNNAIDVRTMLEEAIETTFDMSLRKELEDFVKKINSNYIIPFGNTIQRIEKDMNESKRIHS